MSAQSFKAAFVASNLSPINPPRIFFLANLSSSDNVSSSCDLAIFNALFPSQPATVLGAAPSFLISSNKSASLNLGIASCVSITLFHDSKLAASEEKRLEISFIASLNCLMSLSSPTCD